MGNKMLKLTSFVLLVTMIALTLVSGTYAKYTSSASGTDSAVVAKWNIKAGAKGSETSITGSNATVAFNLFDTINDTGNTADETDVADEKIAPGTAGSFEMSIKNDSEVTARYGISYTLSASDVPIEFSVDDGNTWTTSLSNVAASDSTKIAMNSSKTVTVMWRWAFTGDASTNYTSSQTDETDTALGLSTPTVTVNATLTVEQVD